MKVFVVVFDRAHDSGEAIGAKPTWDEARMAAEAHNEAEFMHIRARPGAPRGIVTPSLGWRETEGQVPPEWQAKPADIWDGSGWDFGYTITEFEIPEPIRESVRFQLQNRPTKEPLALWRNGTMWGNGMPQDSTLEKALDTLTRTVDHYDRSLTYRILKIEETEVARQVKGGPVIRG